MTVATTSSPILIWGAGAIGSVIGAHLIQAGCDVIFVDINRQHIAKINAGALLVDGPVANLTVGARACTPDELQGTYDTILCAVRLADNESALRQLPRYLSSTACVVSCQNGFGALDVAKAVGIERTIAASFFLPAEFRGPGHVTYGSRTDMALGSLQGGYTPALDQALSVLQQFDPGVHAVEDIHSTIWTKLCYGAMLAAVALDHGITTTFLEDPELRPIVVGLAREMTAVARRLGHPPEDTPWFEPNVIGTGDADRVAQSLELTLTRLRRSAKIHSGYWLQIAQLKRPTELPLMFGPVLESARQTATPTPILAHLLSMIAKLESGQIRNGPNLTADLLETARDNGYASIQTFQT